MARVYEMQNTPAVADYGRGLTAIRSQVRDAHLRAFRAHYAAKDRTETATQIAALADIDGVWTVVNSLYGKLGHAFCDQLGIKPELRPDFTHRWWSVWSREWSTRGGFVWQMLPRVAEAFEQLGWVQPDRARRPDAPPAVAPSVGDTSAAKGRELLRLHRTRERSRGLVTRKKQSVLFESGRLVCEACDFDFAATYGPCGEEFADCHHTQSISQSAPGRRTRLSELAVVCANCHRMLHRRPWVSLPDLRALVRSRLGVG